MTAQQILQKEIEDSKTWLSREKEESTYKRDPPLSSKYR
jgi:hypothetical protein